MSDYELVKQFTKESGANITKLPTSMSKDEVIFLIKMVLDETIELASTVMNHNETISNILKILSDIKVLPKLDSEIESIIISEQADALVDIYYYMLNAAAKKNIDISSIFKLVHESNMKKKDPKTNTFLKREDGKIIKPNGWNPPDIHSEILKQFNLNSSNTNINS